MIRINLAVGRGAPSRATGAGLAGWRPAVLAGGLCLVALFWSGARIWSLREEAARVARETALAEDELRRLTPQVRQLEELEAEYAQLAARAAVMDGWRRDRRRVDRLLETIGRSVPAGVRLAQLRQDADGLSLGGQAASVAAVSEFAANLERMEQVAPPVEIVDTREAEAGVDAGLEQLVRFEVRARLTPSGP